MGSVQPWMVADRFSEAINARDEGTLAQLMSEDHRFVDAAGRQVSGKSAALDAWREFFAVFPDYRNDFARFVARSDTVLMEGRLSCSDATFDGPALWSAAVRDGQVVEWRIYRDDTDNRDRLGLSHRPA